MTPVKVQDVGGLTTEEARLRLARKRDPVAAALALNAELAALQAEDRELAARTPLARAPWPRRVVFRRMTRAVRRSMPLVGASELIVGEFEMSRLGTLYHGPAVLVTRGGESWHVYDEDVPPGVELP